MVSSKVVLSAIMVREESVFLPADFFGGEVLAAFVALGADELDFLAVDFLVSAMPEVYHTGPNRPISHPKFRT